MRIVCINSFLFCMLLYSYALPQDMKINVAVNDLNAKGIDRESADIISDRLRAELFKTGAFNVVERDQMEEVLKEQGFQQSGCTSDACVVEIGQLLGVSNMIAGTIGKIGSTFTISIRLIDVATGKILHTANIDHRGIIDDVLSKSTVAIAKMLAKSVDTPVSVQAVEKEEKEEKEEEPVIKQGKLDVSSDPVGAIVFLNNDKMGTTPYTDTSIDAGTYALMIEMVNYTPVKESIKIIAEKTLSKHYTLKHTKSYRDSIKASERKEKKSKPAVSQKKKKFWPKVVFGLISLGSGAVGLIMNEQARQNIDEYKAIENEYTNSESNTNYDNYKQEYSTKYKEAEKNIKIRNVFYIVAGVGMVCFAVSFAF